MSELAASPEAFGRFGPVDVPGAPWPVYQGGEGPPVLLLQELFGFTPAFRLCAETLAAEGFSVWLPVLAGPVPADTKLRCRMAALRVCVSLHVHLFARGAPGGFVEPLRALANYAATATGKQGVGVVGMCFSGGFALALAAGEPVRVGVAAQPSLPWAKAPFTRLATRIGIDDDTEAALRSRLTARTTGIYVTRFSDDPISPTARAREIERRLGVEVDEVPSSLFEGRPHSVLTYGGLTTPEARQQLDRVMADVIAFLRGRLGS